jgi:hypothetical protein
VWFNYNKENFLLKRLKVLEWCYSNKDLCDDSEIEEREDFINELENELFILRGNIE